jgi:hypothetical protein
MGDERSIFGMYRWLVGEWGVIIGLFLLTISFQCVNMVKLMENGEWRMENWVVRMGI